MSEQAIKAAIGFSRHTWRRPRGTIRRRVALAVRLVCLAGLTAWALLTPGFITPLSIFSLLTTVSLIGCVAVGMTFITLTGNIMSLALGATLSAAAMVFLASLSLGTGTAFLLALLFGTVITGAQGAIVGWFRANPLLVSIAALGLIIGFAEVVTGGTRVYPTGQGFRALKGRIAGIPVEVLVFFATVILGQLILSWTRIGRAMQMTGSNPRAAEVAGIKVPHIVTVAYLLAGAFACVSGVLLAARYGSGDMELGSGYDYGAIASVLVGGTAIQGGAGSVLRTLVGATVIAAVQVCLLLRGFSDQLQYFITGLIVLGVVMLQTLGERE
jgi:ribose/xylose/arabinose/galactoside ABC-type transport system permease subunit